MLRENEKLKNEKNQLRKANKNNESKFIHGGGTMLGERRSKMDFSYKNAMFKVLGDYSMSSLDDKNDISDGKNKKEDDKK